MQDVVVAELRCCSCGTKMLLLLGYVACIMLLTSWAIRQLNSGHEATLIPIKKQNLTQGVRKNQDPVTAELALGSFAIKTNGFSSGLGSFADKTNGFSHGLCSAGLSWPEWDWLFCL